MEPMGDDEAAAAWLSITQAMKDNPASVGQAKFIIRMAKRMLQPLPEGCTDLLAAQQPVITLDSLDGITYYVTTGNPLFTGKPGCNKLISFVYLNMDDGFRIKWRNLTGREQYEWYRAYDRCNGTHLRVAAETRGLRGTNINAITDQASLTRAMENSPSLARRRSPNHIIPQHEWDDVRMDLFGDD